MEKEPLLILQQSLSELRPTLRRLMPKEQLVGDCPWQCPEWPQKVDVIQMAKEWDVFLDKKYAHIQIQLRQELLLKENAKRAAARTRCQQFMVGHVDNQIVVPVIKTNTNHCNEFKSLFLQEVRSNLRSVANRISTFKQGIIQLPWQQAGWPGNANARKMAVEWDNFLSKRETAKQRPEEKKAIKILPEETSLLKEKMAKRAAVWRAFLFPEMMAGV